MVVLHHENVPLYSINRAKISHEKREANSFSSPLYPKQCDFFPLPKNKKESKGTAFLECRPYGEKTMETQNAITLRVFLTMRKKNGRTGIL